MPAKSHDTIRRILDAATTSFAGKGYEGARMDKIAARAGVNKATIYYHIGDKKALYAAVLHDVFSEQVEKISHRLKTETAPEQKLKIYIRAMHGMIDERPHIPAIIMREIASGGKHFPDILARDFDRIIGLLGEILDHGHSRNVFSAANPLVIHLMVMTPMAYYKKLIGILKNQNVCGDDCPHRAELSLTAFSAQVERLVLKSLSPSAANEKGPLS